MPLPWLIGAAILSGIGGAVAHVAASNKNDEAEKLLADAQYIFNTEKENLLRVQETTECSIMALAKCKQYTLETSIKGFFQYFNYIKNVQPRYSDGIDEIIKFNITEQDAIQIRELTDIYADTMSGVATGAATGAAIVLATGVGEGALAAAGGALAAGNIGGAVTAAGGLVSLPVMATIAAPALLFTGISSYFDAEENLSRAESTHAEACVAVEKMKYQETLCQGIADRADMFNNLIVQLNGHFHPCVALMIAVIEEKRKRRSIWAKFTGKALSAEDFTEEELNLFRVTRSLAGAIKAAIDIKIIAEDGKVDNDADKNYQEMKDAIPNLATKAQEVQSLPYFAPLSAQATAASTSMTSAGLSTSTAISGKFNKRKIGIAAIFTVVGLLCFGIAGLEGIIIYILGIGFSVYIIDKMRNMERSVTMNKASVIVSYVTSALFFLSGFGIILSSFYFTGGFPHPLAAVSFNIVAVGLNVLGCVLHPATNKKTGFLARHFIVAVVLVIMNMLLK